MLMGNFLSISSELRINTCSCSIITKRGKKGLQHCIYCAYEYLIYKCNTIYRCKHIDRCNMFPTLTVLKMCIIFSISGMRKNPTCRVEEQEATHKISDWQMIHSTSSTKANHRQKVFMSIDFLF